MASNRIPAAICSTASDARPDAIKYSRLDPFLTLLTLWLAVTILIVSFEWVFRNGRLRSTPVYDWNIRLPGLGGILPSIFAVVWALSANRPQSYYVQSADTVRFLDACSAPSDNMYTSLISTKHFFLACSAVQNRMNADIGGVEIRLSLYVSLLVSVGSSFGHFHQEKTAVKEVGTAQLACKCQVSSIGR